MDLGISKKVEPLINKVKTMINEEIKPKERDFFDEVSIDGRWKLTSKQIKILDDGMAVNYTNFNTKSAVICGCDLISL